MRKSRRRCMTGDAMEIYCHRVSCRPFPFWCLAAKAGELGIFHRSFVCVFVFVRVSCSLCSFVFVRFLSAVSKTIWCKTYVNYPILSTLVSSTLLSCEMFHFQHLYYCSHACPCLDVLVVILICKDVACLQNIGGV